METIKIGKVNDTVVYANWNCMADGFVSLGKLTKTDLINVSPNFKILCDGGCYPGSIDEMDKNICDEAYEEYTE